MEVQIANEIYTFWSTLVPPIFLGILSLLLFGWIIGKDNRNRIMTFFIKNDCDSSGYILQNGIYIPKDYTTKQCFFKYISKKMGFESMKPLMLVFFIILIFFGINQILINIFQPLITYAPSRLLYSCGVDDYLLAEIWSYYPAINNPSQLYVVIDNLVNDVNRSSDILLCSIEAYIRFDLTCCFIMVLYAFFKRQQLKAKIFLRLFLTIIFLLCTLMGVLFFNIQKINDRARYNCYEAYSILERQYNLNNNENMHIQNEKIDTYVEIIMEERNLYEQDLFYGAFGIRNGLADSIRNTFKEFHRFFNSNQ